MGLELCPEQWVVEVGGRGRESIELVISMVNEEIRFGLLSAGLMEFIWKFSVDQMDKLREQDAESSQLLHTTPAGASRETQRHYHITS